MNALERLIALLVLAAGFVFTSGQAKAYPAAVTPGACSNAPCYSYRAAVGYAYYPTPQQAADSQVGRASVGGCGTILTATAYGVGPTAYWTATCTAGSVSAVTFNTVSRTPDQPVYSCPGGGTLSGVSCVCPSGQTDTGTACVDQQAELCNALAGTETYASAPGSISPGASSCNATGCMTTFADTLIRIKDKQGVTVTEGAAKFTGATCTFSPETGSTEDTCPQGFQGDVNGVQTCVKYDPKLNTIETTGKSEKETTEGGNSTQQSISSTTSCSNGSCNTTTTTTTVVNGGTPTTKTETKTEPQSDFCRDNPRSPQCSEDGTFSGACDSPAVCTGDAVQCAQAVAAHKLQCSSVALPSAVSDAAGSVVGGEIPDGFFIDGPSLTPPEAMPAAGACPLVDQEIPWLGEHTLTFSISRFCPHMETIRAFLSVFGALAFALIVFRG